MVCLLPASLHSHFTDACVPPPSQSRIDTPNKCKRILDDAGLGASYDDNTPPMKLRVLAAGALAAESGVVAAPPSIVPDIEVPMLFFEPRARTALLPSSLPTRG